MEQFGGEQSNQACKQTFEFWHKCVLKRELTLMRPLIDKECVFHSPTVRQPFKGPDALCVILESVSEVFGTTLQYERQWISKNGKEWALEFVAQVKDQPIKGLDLIKLNDEGKIIKFEVVVRPYKGVGALKQEMEKLVPIKIAKLMNNQKSKL